MASVYTDGNLDVDICRDIGIFSSGSTGNADANDLRDRTEFYAFA